MRSRRSFAVIAAGMLALVAALALFAASGEEQAKTPTVLVTDNAFVLGVDRPTVTINSGEKITWRWTAQQSHGVSVRQGPARFSIPVRTDGRVTHSFSKAGTYSLVCPLHAPGMKMTVVVKS